MWSNFWPTNLSAGWEGWIFTVCSRYIMLFRSESSNRNANACTIQVSFGICGTSLAEWALQQAFPLPTAENQASEPVCAFMCFTSVNYLLLSPSSLMSADPLVMKLRQYCLSCLATWQSASFRMLQADSMVTAWRSTISASQGRYGNVTLWTYLDGSANWWLHCGAAAFWLTVADISSEHTGRRG